MQNVYNISRTNCGKGYLDYFNQKANRKCNQKKIYEKDREQITKEGEYGLSYT